MADGHPNGNGAQSTALTRAPIAAGGQVAAIVAHSFDDAYRIAKALSQSGMTPQGITTPEQCLAVILAGAEIGMPPFQALQSFALINGRPALWGDGMLGVVRRHGVRVEERTEGAIADMSFIATCKVTRPDTGEVIERQFSALDAKRAGLWQTEARVKRKGKDGWYEKDNDSPWYRYPQRMVQMRARSWALRDGCADMLRGMKMAEEMQDVEVVDSVVIDRTGDADQRPADERSGPMIGKPARDTYDDLAQRMFESEDAAALEIVFDEAEKANLSQNRMFALAEYYEACKEAHERGLDLPAPPRFTEAPEPSPFAKLKAEAEAIGDDAEKRRAWLTSITADVIGKCSESERTELKRLYAAMKSGAGAATRKEGEDANAASDGDGKPGGEPASASSSPFEALKEQGLAILTKEGKRRQRAAFTAWLEALVIGKPKCSPMEQRELETVQANIGKEIGA